MSHTGQKPYATVAGEPLLLLDESLIERETGLQRSVVPGVKSPALLEPDRDKPWEYCGPGMSKRIHLYGTVLYDDLLQKYRMWYFGRMGPHWREPACSYQIPDLYIPRTDEKPYHYRGSTTDRHGRTFQDNDRGDLTLYAESDDGISWDKPNLGIFTFDGSPDNNIVWDLHGASVFIDRDGDDTAKRYKAIGFCRRYRGIFLLTSHDGIHWDEDEHLEPVAARRNEGTFNVTHDARAGLYRSYSIQRFDDRDKRRVICYTESRALEGPWKAAQPMLEPNSWDDEMARRKYGGLRAEFHNLSGFQYGHMHIGLLGVLYVTAEQVPDESNQMPCDGPIDAQIVYSRDGMSWHHGDRQRTAAIPRGQSGDDFDRGMIIGTAKEPVIEGDQVHWYYTGCEHTHGERNMERRIKRIARATWQRDRFVGLRADAEGTLLTRPLLPPRSTRDLVLNADAADGQIQVELCDASGAPLPGYTRQDCVALGGDDLRWRVRWREADISSVDGPIRIGVTLKRATLYSITFSDETS